MSKLLVLFLAGIFFSGTKSTESNSRPNASKSKASLAAISPFITYSPAQFITGVRVGFADSEPNDTRATASLLPVNAITGGVISSSTDIDYYKFRVLTNYFYISLTNLPANYDIRLYNSAGTLLNSSQNSGTTDESIMYYPATVGVYYYLQVYGYNGANSQQSYELEVYAE